MRNKLNNTETKHINLNNTLFDFGKACDIIVVREKII